jgi:hypothetical protein
MCRCHAQTHQPDLGRTGPRRSIASVRKEITTRPSQLADLITYWKEYGYREGKGRRDKATPRHAEEETHLRPSHFANYTEKRNGGVPDGTDTATEAGGR